MPVLCVPPESNVPPPSCGGGLCGFDEGLELLHAARANAGTIHAKRFEIRNFRPNMWALLPKLHAPPMDRALRMDDASRPRL